MNNNNINSNEKLIDLKKVFKNSKSNLLRNIPGFIINIMRYTIRENIINSFIINHKEDKGLDFIQEALKYLNVKINIIGEEKLQQNVNKRFIFIANHPLGAVDGFAIYALVGKYFPNIKAVVNELLTRVENVKELFIPVDSFGGSQKEYIDNLNKIFESEIAIFIFPSGEVARKYNGEIKELHWQKTFITRAVKHNRDIFPIYVHASNSRLFYFIAKIRRVLKIKANIELFLLPREMFKAKNKEITLILGDPVPYQTFTAEKNSKQWAEYMREHVYNLKKTIK